VPSSKASRRQVSIGSFNAIPVDSSLAQALAAVSNSPPLPPVPVDDEDVEAAKESDALSPALVDSATPLTPGFPLSPDPFGRQSIFTDKAQGVRRDLKLVTETKSKGFPNVTSPVSPPPRMSSRFSADSEYSDDGQPRNDTRADRAASIISVKGIRSLWRKSSNPKNSVPLMSPGINGQHMVPPPPSPFVDGVFVPPLPLSSGGYYSSMTTGPPPAPKTAASTGSAMTPTTSQASEQPSTVHGRSDSGLDPFHFDQDSRYPVHKLPSPSQAFTDTVPPSAPAERSNPSPPPAPSGGGKKGILKGWGSKGSSMKRTSGELVNASRVASSSPQTSNHPPSSFGSIGHGKKGRRPSLTNMLSNGGHSKQSSKASISSVGTNGRHNHPNNSLSGTSHASSHQGVPNVPLQPDLIFNLTPSLQPSASGRSSHEATPGHKTSGSSGLMTTPNSESRKSTTPPPAAIAMAVAVAASRERRGTSYIGPADNRI